MSYRCQECGRMIDCLDAMLTASYHLCPRCLHEAIRTSSVAAKRAFRRTKAETERDAKKDTYKARVRVSPVKAGSKASLIGDLLRRQNGCTYADVLAATGWPSVSMPVQAKSAGLKLRREKVPGQPMRYFGS